ncbi:MAG: DUF3299 domain-containing protein [Candidatus Goldiibacteriota bacterium]
MNRRLSKYIFSAVVSGALCFLYAAGAFAAEIKVDGGAITQVKETPAAEPVKDAAYLKVESMPNPVTAYPVVDGYPLVTWETLAAYDYDAPSMEDQKSVKIRMQKKKRAIPDFITVLNGTKIAITGFLIPVDTDETGEFATVFVIVRSQMTCCYGVVPKLNEWVMVTMEKNKRIRAVSDVPTTVFGTIDVGEKYEDMKGWTLYRMTAEKTSIRKNSF